jgi:hypothetical protein
MFFLEFSFFFSMHRNIIRNSFEYNKIINGSPVSDFCDPYHFSSENIMYKFYNYCKSHLKISISQKFTMVWMVVSFTETFSKYNQ